MRFALVIGNVGSKPEIRTANNGTTYSNFSVAISESYKHREPETERYDVMAFGKLAETLAHVEAGDELLVVGNFHQVAYTGNDQVKHRSIEIRAWDIKFLRRKDRGRAGQPAPAGPADWTALAAVTAAGPVEDALAGTLADREAGAAR